MSKNYGNDHKLVQVNASSRSTGTTADFSVDFLTRALDKVTKVVMIKASLPRLFTNIWSANNIITISHAGANFSFIVPEGQYNTTTLAAALTTATAGINMAWAFNATTNRFTATYTGVTTATLVSDTTLSTIANYIGLTQDITLGAPSDLTSPPQLSGVDEVFIRSQLIAADSCIVSGSQQSIPFVGSISFTDVPYGFVGRFDCKDLEIGHVDFAYQTCLRKINIQLTDVYGNIINTPDNCFLDMILQFTVANFS